MSLRLGRIKGLTPPGGILSAFEASLGLGKTANLVTPPTPSSGGGRPPKGEGDPAQRGRGGAVRYRLTHAAATIEPHHPRRVRVDGDELHPEPHRTALCGWATQQGEYAHVARATMPDGSTRAKVGGVQTCGSVWTCAVCATAIANDRARDVVAVVEHARSQGWAVYMLTLTVRHDYGDKLARMRTSVADAWRAFVRGAPWKRWKDAHGIETVRRLEATHGANGWHPHLHVLVVAERPIPERDFTRWARDRWSTMVERYIGARHVGEAPFDVDFERVGKHHSAARYLSKLGLEMTDALQAKAASNGNRSPWALLMRHEELQRDTSGGAANERARCAESWREWSRAMYGARQLTWSRRARSRAGLGEETPEELAAAFDAMRGVAVVAIPPGLHRELLRKPWVRETIASAIERGDDVRGVALAVRREHSPVLANELLAWNTEERLGSVQGRLIAQRDAMRERIAWARLQRTLRRDGFVRPSTVERSMLERAVACWKLGDDRRRARIARVRERESRSEWVSTFSPFGASGVEAPTFIPTSREAFARERRADEPRVVDSSAQLALPLDPSRRR